MSNKKHNVKYLKRRDIFGRDYSVLLSSLPTADQYREIDPYAHDLESNYTPLHITLRQNQLKKAFKVYKIWKTEKEYIAHKHGGHILDQKDREGLTPIDMYNIQLHNNIMRYPKMLNYEYPAKSESHIVWEPEAADLPFAKKASILAYPSSLEERTYLKENRGSHILTLGSNTNYQLGTGAKDDRQNLFQVNIDQINGIVYPPTDNKFKSVFISRYHTIVTTKDDEIFVSGNSSRGRLGNGSTEKPLFSFTKLDDDKHSKIVSLASSENHSVLLDDEGTVFTWGWNAYSQLCYSPTNNGGRMMDDKSLDSVCNSTPRRVHFFDNKNVSIVGCSSVHTCVLTSDNVLYSWGLNLGQMGGSKISHVAPDAQYLGESGHIMAKPVTLNLSHLDVEQIVATEFATFVRCKGNTLVVLAEYSMRTFKIALPKAQNFKEPDPFKHFVPRGRPHDIVDIKCSNSYGNNVGVLFSCGTIGLISTKKDSTRMWSKFSNNLPISLYWNPYRTINNCLDFDVGAKGSVILCTYSGEVYRSSGVNKGFDKIHGSKLASGRAVRVSCDSSFDSFAIIKDESNDIIISHKPNEITQNYSHYSPASGNKSVKPESIIYGPYSDLEQPESETRSGKIRSQNISIPVMKYPFDVEFINEHNRNSKQGCHKIMIMGRCIRLLRYLKESGLFSVDDDLLTFKMDNTYDSKRWSILVGGKASAELIDDVISGLLNVLYMVESQIKHQTTRLITTIIEDSLHSAKTNHHFTNLLQLCLDDSDHDLKQLDAYHKPDTIIHLSGDVKVSAHSYILFNRSSYFNSWFSEAWRQTGLDDYYHVELPDITIAAFQPILKYIYGVPFEKTFYKELESYSFMETLNYLLSLLQICDELCIIPLKIYLESVLSKFVNGGTVIPVLLNASQSNASLLLENCMVFIYTHIGILLFKENLSMVDECFDDDIWSRLEVQTNSFKADSTSQQTFSSWYDMTGIDWIDLFKTNIAKFNSHFMSGSYQFEPSFDLTSTSEKRSRRRSSTRRASSSHQNSGHRHSVSKTSRQPSNGSYDNSQFPIELRNPWSSVTSLNSANSSAIEDDISDFIEVVRKPKRKSTVEVARRPSEISPVRAEIKPSEIVWNEETTSNKENLPSLLGKDLKERSKDTSEKTSKITGTFKKTSQKQRKTIVDISSIDSSPKEKKVGWGSSSSRKSSNNSKTKGKPSSQRSSSVGGTSLPSLLDATSQELKPQPKRSKRRGKSTDTDKVKYTEFVSSGNPGGITPYATSTVQPVNEIANVFGDKSGEAVSSLEEQIAALEFEKWFAQESSKVKKKMKSGGNGNTDLSAIYTNVNSMPVLLNDTDVTHSKKKVRGNFKKKESKSLSDLF
ncbi:hypothetical protein DAKH74_035780 [Maudiozyma humilis]|uniref:BTB domain-containing protein n=1 Tax=Maudiozyma humilis TaxID=51915 RepID=A0AAV5S1X9_MAUHU|nr:hypothetical protein DAKH74_035780 [Kazachstania humilis]